MGVNATFDIDLSQFFSKKKLKDEYYGYLITNLYTGRKKELCVEALMNPEEYKAQLEAQQAAYQAQQQFDQEEQYDDEGEGDLNDLVNGGQFQVDANDKDAMLAAKMQQQEIQEVQQREAMIQQRRQVKAMQKAQMRAMEQQMLQQQMMASQQQQQQPNVYEL